MEKYIPLFEQYGKIPEKIYRGRQMIMAQCEGNLYALMERKILPNFIRRPLE